MSKAKCLIQLGLTYAALGGANEKTTFADAALVLFWYWSWHVFRRGVGLGSGVSLNEWTSSARHITSEKCQQATSRSGADWRVVTQ
jgi:hypothetical protein